MTPTGTRRSWIILLTPLVAARLLLPIGAVVPGPASGRAARVEGNSSESESDGGDDASLRVDEVSDAE